MKIQIIESLPKDDNSNLIDFTASVTQPVGTSMSFATTTTARHNMRMDLLTYDMTGNQELIGEIMLINDLTNPFKIKDGITLSFTSSEDLKRISSKSGVDADENLKKLLINKNKAQQVDSSRIKYISDKQKREKDKNNIPAQIITDGSKAVETGAGFIKLNPIL